MRFSEIKNFRVDGNEIVCSRTVKLEDKFFKIMRVRLAKI